MRSVVQRVRNASVKSGQVTVGRIEHGILVLIGIGREDGPRDLAWMADKLCGLRIFEDEQGKMNLSVRDVQGKILLVSQFTLFGDCRKGKRPSFSEAAPPAEAECLLNQLVQIIREKGIDVETGKFQTHMEVELVNSGPVTILDSRV